MKKAVALLLVLVLCMALCACGDQVKYQKYDTLIGYIEAGDSRNAVNEVLSLIEQNGAGETEPPEVATTTMEITMDNWQDFFEVELSALVGRNAFDEIDNAYSQWRISLKEEYRERLTNADVAFGCRMSEYSKCEFTYNLQTELATMSVISLSDDVVIGDMDETCSFEYDNTTFQDSFYVALAIYSTSFSKPSVDDNKVTWKGYEFANIEITRVQGTITLKTE